jgi:hypothetical protein
MPCGPAGCLLPLCDSLHLCAVGLGLVMRLPWMTTRVSLLVLEYTAESIGVPNPLPSSTPQRLMSLPSMAMSCTSSDVLVPSWMPWCRAPVMVSPRMIA